MTSVYMGHSPRPSRPALEVLALGAVPWHESKEKRMWRGVKGEAQPQKLEEIMGLGSPRRVCTAGIIVAGLLKAAGLAVLSALVGILASTGNEVVLVNLLVVLTVVLVMWKQNQNILAGRMKEADTKCENGPEPATAVTGFYFGTSNVYQPCDKCRQRVRKEEVTNIFGCDHSICIYCIRSNLRYFTESQAHGFLLCPVCHRPNIFESKTFGLAYLSTLSISAEKILSEYWYQKFKEALEKVVTILESIEQNECASKFSSAISSRNSLNDYVEKRQTTCPNCRVHCDLTRQVGKWVECHRCKASYCGTCKASYSNGCEKTFCFKKFFHLHHHEICFYTKDRFGIDKLKLILKSNKVDFVDTIPVSGVCLLREVYNCPSKPFRSDLCRYHYEDYLANLILQSNLKTSSNWS